MATMQTRLRRTTSTLTPALTPTPKVEPTLGLWSDRLALALLATLLPVLVPVTMAFGLGWVSREQTLMATATIGRVVFVVWTLSLVGVALGVVGLSQLGTKRRTIRGLLLHAALALGPLAAALVLRS